MMQIDDQIAYCDGRHARLLAEILHRERPTMRELGATLGVSIATVCAWKGHLIDDGLLIAPPGAHLGLRVTDKGLRWLAECGEQIRNRP